MEPSGSVLGPPRHHMCLPHCLDPTGIWGFDQYLNSRSLLGSNPSFKKKKELFLIPAFYVITLLFILIFLMFIYF